MDLDKIFIKNASPTKVGGQAVLEGIMMKGEDRTAVAIRKPDGGMHIKTQMLPPKNKLRKIPVLRGVFMFVDSLVTGTKTLLYSAEVLESFEDTEGNAIYEKDKFTIWLEKRFGEKGALNLMLYFSVVLALIFTIGIFIIAPTAVVHLFTPIVSNEVALNLIEGAFRIILFVLYIVLISKMSDIQTVFRFHGAEHQCIHCYENKLDLTPENCQTFETLHPRCGTSFLMFVMVISLLLFSLLGWPNLFLRILSRLLLIPVIAGLSYELLRWAGSSDAAIVKVVSLPGLALQKLTTKRPDRQELEVAIAAMKAVMVDKDTPIFEGACDLEGKPLQKSETEAEPNALSVESGQNSESDEKDLEPPSTETDSKVHKLIHAVQDLTGAAQEHLKQPVQNTISAGAAHLSQFADKVSQSHELKEEWKQEMKRELKSELKDELMQELKLEFKDEIQRDYKQEYKDKLEQESKRELIEKLERELGNEQPKSENEQQELTDELPKSENDRTESIN